MSSKIVGLEVSSKMLLTVEIVKDIETYNFSKIKIKEICESQINWDWSDMARPGQINSKLCVSDISKMVKFPLYIEPP